MKKLLSITLSLSLLFNMCTPAFAHQMANKPNLYSSASIIAIAEEVKQKTKNEALQERVDIALKTVLPYTERASFLLAEARAALNEGNRTLYREKEKEMAQIKAKVGEFLMEIHDIEVKIAKDKAYYSGIHPGEIVPSSIPFRELQPLSTYDQLQKAAEEKRVTFSQVVNYIRPFGEGSLYSSDPMAVAYAAQVVGQVAASINGDEADLFAKNELFRNPNDPIATNPSYILETMLFKLTELGVKKDPSLEEIQAIGSLRLAILQVLKFYFRNNIPNPKYFYDLNKPNERPTGQETAAQRKASQELLMQRMYENSIQDIKKYFGKGSESDIAKMTAFASFAIVYTAAYKPNSVYALHELFKIIPVDQDNARKCKAIPDDWTDKTTMKCWEDPTNELDQKYNAVLIGMLATVSDLYRNNGQPVPWHFYKAIMARPDEPGSIKHYFPLLVRLTAMEEALSFNPAKGSDISNFIAYQAKTIYCPLMHKQGWSDSDVYGLDAKKAMPELASRIADMTTAVWADPATYGQRSTPAYLKANPTLIKYNKSNPLQEIDCIITQGTENNKNMYSIQLEEGKKHLGYVVDAIFWIYGGKLIQGAFGILKRVALLPFAVVRSVKVGYTAYKDIKLAREAQGIIEFSIAEAKTARAAEGVYQYGMSILADAQRIKDLSVINNYRNVAAEADRIVDAVKAGTASARQTRNATRINQLSKEVKSLTKELEEARKEILEVESRLSAQVTPGQAAKALEAPINKAQQIERKLQTATQQLGELTKSEKLVATTGKATEGTGAAGKASEGTAAAGKTAEGTAAAGKATEGTAAAGKATEGTGAAGKANKAAQGTEQTAQGGQAAAQGIKGAEKSGTLSSPAMVEESYTAYEGAVKRAFKAAGRNLSDEIIGMRAVKGFFRRNQAQLIFEVENAEGEVELLLVNGNQACRKWAPKARKAYIRQNTFQSPVYFELSKVPSNYAELGQMFRGAKTSIKAAKASGNIEAGFRNYTIAQSKAINEIVRYRSTLARRMANNGGVDVYVEVEKPAMQLYSPEGELINTVPGERVFWNTSAELPAGYTPVAVTDDAIVYILPKGASSNVAGEATLQTAKDAMKKTVAQLQDAIMESTVENLAYRVTGVAYAHPRVATMVEKLTPKFMKPGLKPDVTLSNYVRSAAVADMAVTPTQFVMDSGKNLITRAGAFLATPFPASRTSSVFLKAAAPKYVPNGLKKLYTYSARGLASEFSQNLIAFELILGLDNISYLRDVQTGMFNKFQERDLETSLKKYPNLKRALDEEKAAPKKPTIAQSVQEASAQADKNFQALVFTIPLYAARRLLSDTRDLAGISSASWLQFTTVSDVQEEMFQMREKQLALAPALEAATTATNMEVFNKALDKQKETLVQGENVKSLKAQDATLKSDLGKMTENFRKEVQTIMDQKGVEQKDKNEQIQKARARYDKEVHDRVLQAEEKSYKNSPNAKGNQKLQQEIGQIFDGYRNKTKKIFDNTGKTPQQKQQELTAARKELDEKLRSKMNQVREDATLASKGVADLIKTEGGAKKSQLQKDIKKAFNQYKQQEAAIIEKYSQNTKADTKQMRAELEAAQLQLDIAVQNAITQGNLRAFKNAPSSQAFIAMDESFETAVDAAFKEYSKKMTEIAKSSASQKQKQQQGQQVQIALNEKLISLQNEFGLKIFDSQLNAAEKTDITVNPEIVMLAAAYPDLRNELHNLYETYRANHKALFAQPTSANEKLDDTIKAQEEKFLQNKQQIVVNYYKKAQADAHFWTSVAQNVTEQQWGEIAAMRQSINLYRLMQAIPGLEKNENKGKVKDGKKPLDIVNERLAEFMDLQIDFYKDKSITNKDVAMIGLIAQENEFMGNFIYLCNNPTLLQQIYTKEAKEAQDEGDDLPESEVQKQM